MVKVAISYILKTLAVGSAFLLLGCMGKITYHSCQPIANQIWRNNDKLYLQIDSLASYDNLSLQVELRTLEEYP